MFCLENIIVFFNSTKKLIWNFLSFTSANMHGIRNILSGITTVSVRGLWYCPPCLFGQYFGLSMRTRRNCLSRIHHVAHHAEKYDPRGIQMKSTPKKTNQQLLTRHPKSLPFVVTQHYSVSLVCDKRTTTRSSSTGLDSNILFMERMLGSTFFYTFFASKR